MSTRLLRSLSLVALSLMAGSLSASDQPPQTLHFVQGHWTAWDPPASLPEGVKVHIVEPGDTLWALAQRELGNPYLWPQIWEKNQYILDAHWIYPGDPIVLGLAVAPAEATGAELGEGALPPSAEGELIPEGAAGEVAPPAAEAEPGTEAEPGAEAAAGRSGILSSGKAAGAPVPLGSEDDIYCTGYIGDVDESFPYTITGSEYQVLSPTMAVGAGGRTQGIYGTVDTVKYDLSVGDVIYVDGGRAAGLAPGTVLTAVAAGSEIPHPWDREIVGRRYSYLGRVRVLSVQETSGIAEIVQSCRPVLVGARLKVFEPEPVPLARRTPLRPVNLPTSAEALADAPVILTSAAEIVSLGQDHVVFIDRDSDMTPGDVFTIYRTNREGFPPVVLGELAVLSVHQRSAVAKIIESRYPIYVGDRLERK